MSETKYATRKREVRIAFEGDECSNDCPFYCESYTTDRCGDREYYYYCSLYDEADVDDDKRVEKCLEEFGT